MSMTHNTNTTTNPNRIVLIQVIPDSGTSNTTNLNSQPQQTISLLPQQPCQTQPTHQIAPQQNLYFQSQPLQLQLPLQENQNPPVSFIPLQPQPQPDTLLLIQEVPQNQTLQPLNQNTTLLQTQLPVQSLNTQTFNLQPQIYSTTPVRQNSQYYCPHHYQNQQSLSRGNQSGVPVTSTNNNTNNNIQNNTVSNQMTRTQNRYPLRPWNSSKRTQVMDPLNLLRISNNHEELEINKKLLEQRGFSTSLTFGPCSSSRGQRYVPVNRIPNTTTNNNMNNNTTNNIRPTPNTTTVNTTQLEARNNKNRRKRPLESTLSERTSQDGSVTSEAKRVKPNGPHEAPKEDKNSSSKLETLSSLKLEALLKETQKLEKKIEEQITLRTKELEEQKKNTKKETAPQNRTSTPTPIKKEEN